MVNVIITLPSIVIPFFQQVQLIIKFSLIIIIIIIIIIIKFGINLEVYYSNKSTNKKQQFNKFIT
jgi:hypothetical protein